MKRFFLSTFSALTLMVAVCCVSTVQAAEKSDVAVLVIDMQNDFVLPGAILCVEGALPTVPAIADLMKHGRSKEWPIIHVIREHRPSGVDVDAPRVRLFENGGSGYCVPGTKGCEIVDGLTPEPGDIIVSKRRNSAFFETELHMILSRMGIKTVVIAGTQYPNCVRGTAADAMSHDYETVICLDACSARTPEVAAANILDMRNMGIKCISLEEVKSDI